jgi:hypothetical protein
MPVILVRYPNEHVLVRYVVASLWYQLKGAQ